MAANGDELEAVLIKYIDLDPVEDRLRELLKSTPVDVRHNLLYRERGITGVYRAAWRNDEETLKLMLADFTPTQRYEVVRTRNRSNYTAVHVAAFSGHTDIIIQLLSHLSYEHRFNILKVQTSSDRDTALHWAAKEKFMESLQLLLSSVTPQQQNELLNIKNTDNKTIVKIVKLPELHFAPAALTNQELRDANQKIAALERDKVQQHQELRDANQRIAALDEKCNQQEQALANFGQNQIQMERMIAELDRVLREPISIGPEMDQEHEHED